jgi:hypothetical protein
MLTEAQKRQLPADLAEAYEAAIRRLRHAASELESAASGAAEAIDDAVSELALPEQGEEGWLPADFEYDVRRLVAALDAGADNTHAFRCEFVWPVITHLGGR